MAEALSHEEQIMALRRELVQRDAIIAAHEAALAEAAVVKARLTTALLEIEQIKMQLATLRRQRYGQSSERLDDDITQLEMRLEDCEEKSRRADRGTSGAGSPPHVQATREVWAQTAAAASAARGGGA